ncbi:MAG: beta strand repeat-containing protein [Anaerovoracaceae bacterium]
MRKTKLSRISSLALGIIIALAMVFTTLPANFGGAEEVQAAAQTTGIDVSAATADASGPNWTWKNSTKTLSLNGVNIDSGTSKAIKVPTDTTVELLGLNTVTSTNATYDEGTIQAVGALTIKGSGILDVSNTGAGAADTNAALYAGGNITVESGHIKATKTNVNSGAAFLTKDALTVNGGYIDTSGNQAKTGVYAKSASITGGYVKAVSGISTNVVTTAFYIGPSGGGAFTISGGYLDATAGTAVTGGSKAISCATFQNSGGVVKATANSATNSPSLAITASTSAAFSGGVTIAKCGTGAGSPAFAAISCNAANAITASNSESYNTSTVSGAITGLTSDNRAIGASTTPANDVVVAKRHFSSEQTALTGGDTALDGYYINTSAGDAIDMSDAVGLTITGGNYIETSAAAQHAGNVKFLNARKIGGAGTLVGKSDTGRGLYFNKSTGFDGKLIGLSNSSSGLYFDTSAATFPSTAEVIGISTASTSSANTAGILFSSTAPPSSGGNLIGIAKGTLGYGIAAYGNVNITGGTVTTSSANSQGLGTEAGTNCTLAISGGSVTAVGNNTTNPALGYYSAGTLNITGGKVWAYNKNAAGPSIKADSLAIGTALTVKALAAGDDYGDILTNRASTGNVITEKIAYIEATAPLKTLSSIAITKQPTKTFYLKGETFDKTGMIVTATYSDKSKKAVTEYTASPSRPLEYDNKTIKVSYTENGITKDVTVPIFVGVLSANIGGQAYGKNAIKLIWAKVPTANKYEVWGIKCGKDNQYKKLKTLSGTTFIHKGLRTNKSYRYYLAAYNGSTLIKKSDFPIHVNTSGSKKYDNAKSLTLTTPSFTIVKGGTAQIKAVASTKTKKKLFLHTAQKPLRYKTTDPSVATVDSNGKITMSTTAGPRAMAKNGPQKSISIPSCKILVITNNGIYKYVTVTLGGLD